MSDLSAWLNKQEAAQRLGVSERTLDRMADKGPERRMRARPGRKPEPVFNPEDVERLASKAFVVPAALVPSEELATRQGPPPVLQMLLSVIQSLATTSHAKPQAALFLTLDEAAEYSGLSKSFLRRVVREGQIPSVKDGLRTKISRHDLDNFASVAGLAKYATEGRI